MNDHEFYLRAIEEVAKAVKAQGKDTDRVLLTRQQAAAALRITLQNLDTLTRTGKLRPVYEGRELMVRQSELDRYMEEGE